MFDWFKDISDCSEIGHLVADGPWLIMMTLCSTY